MAAVGINHRFLKLSLSHVKGRILPKDTKDRFRTNDLIMSEHSLLHCVANRSGTLDAVVASDPLIGEFDQTDPATSVLAVDGLDTHTAVL